MFSMIMEKRFLYDNVGFRKNKKMVYELVLWKMK